MLHAKKLPFHAFIVSPQSPSQSFLAFLDSLHIPLTSINTELPITSPNSQNNLYQNHSRLPFGNHSDWLRSVAAACPDKNIKTIFTGHSIPHLRAYLASCIRNMKFTEDFNPLYSHSILPASWNQICSPLAVICPLLKYSKIDMIKYIHANRIDHVLLDISHSEWILPSMIQQNEKKIATLDENLDVLSRAMYDTIRENNRDVDRIRQNSSVFNPSIGTVHLSVNPHSGYSEDQWIHNPYTAHLVLRKLLMSMNGFVHPSNSLVEKCRAYILNYSARTDCQYTLFALGNIALCPPSSKIGRNIWTFARQPFLPKFLYSLLPILPGKCVLWDNRYSVSMESKSANSTAAMNGLDVKIKLSRRYGDAEQTRNGYFLKVFTREDMKTLKQTLLSSRSYQKSLTVLLSSFKNLPSPVHETLPCVIKIEQGIVWLISLPTIGIQFGSTEYLFNANSISHQIDLLSHEISNADYNLLGIN
ncbi:hypothetical protein BC833DRAFT_562153 [Globomyces pollinis-pini]|nr:hypothetical protein BC833DRAFT_562153 [Globomyces pollinis-pini]